MENQPRILRIKKLSVAQLIECSKTYLRPMDVNPNFDPLDPEGSSIPMVISLMNFFFNRTSM